MSKKTNTWSRLFTAAVLLAALVTTGGMTGYQPDRAPSSGDTVPRCC